MLKTFTDLYYGPAGGKIREYLDLLERASAKGGANISWFPALSAYNFIDAETMSRASRILDEEERMVATEPELVRRVEHARLSLDRLYLIRAGAYRKSLDMAGRKDVVLPDYAKTARFCASMIIIYIYDKKSGKAPPVRRTLMALSTLFGASYAHVKRLFQ